MERTRENAIRLHSSGFCKTRSQEVIRLSELLEAARNICSLKDLDIAGDFREGSDGPVHRRTGSKYSNIEEINHKVRANLDKEKAEDDAKEYRTKYDNLTKQLEETRDKKNELLISAELPLPELSRKKDGVCFDL